MDNYKPNSHKYKENQETSERRVEKVISGTAKTKKNEVRKFRDVFISEDISNVKSYILMDVLVPAIKNAIVDIVTDGVNMIFGTGSGRKKTSGANYVSYRDYSRESRRDDSRASTGRFNYDDILFPSRGEADAVLEQMDAIIEEYGYVTVADMYDMADLAAPYTGNRYGWTSVRRAEIVRVRGGDYVIKLPKAMPIDR